MVELNSNRFSFLVLAVVCYWDASLSLQEITTKEEPDLPLSPRMDLLQALYQKEHWLQAARETSATNYLSWNSKSQSAGFEVTKNKMVCSALE